MNDPAFNPRLHAHLNALLSASGFPFKYADLCRKYSKSSEIDVDPKLDFKKLYDIFKKNDPTAKQFKRWRMIEFGSEEIGGWVWTGSLVAKRYDILDPMLDSVRVDRTEGIGSVWIGLARDANKLLPEDQRLPEMAMVRPEYDGTMECMERMVPDLIALFGEMKEIIRHGWSNQP